MGNAETGQAWGPIGAAVWGINGNKAYMAAPTDGDATWVTAAADGTLQCDVLYRNDGDGILFRGLGVAGNDGFLVYLSTTHIHLLVPGFGSQLGIGVSAHTSGTTYTI